MNHCYNCNNTREVGQRESNIGISVQLPFVETIDDLANIVNQGRYSEVERDQNYICPNCNDARSQNELVPTVLPKVLLVQAKRFTNQLINNQVVAEKDNRNIRPANVILNGVSYRLVSICCHVGTLAGGHYTCAKKVAHQKYVEIDDLGGGMQQRAKIGDPQNGYLFLLEREAGDQIEIPLIDDVMEPMDTLPVPPAQNQQEPMEVDGSERPRTTSTSGRTSVRDADVPIDSEFLMAFSLEELERLTQKLGMFIDNLPNPEDEKKQMYADCLKKQIMSLGYSVEYVKKLSEPDESPLIDQFIQKMIKAQVKSVLKRLEVEGPPEGDKAGVAKYRDVLRLAVNSSKLSLKEVQRLTWDHKYKKISNSDHLMTEPLINVLNKTQTEIERSMELLLTSNPEARDAAELYFGHVPANYNEVCVLLKQNPDFIDFENDSYQKEFQHHQTVMNQSLSSKDIWIADKVLEFKSQLRQLQNPEIFFKKFVLPNDHEAHMNHEDPSLTLFIGHRKITETPATFSPMKETDFPIDEPTDQVKIAKFLGLQEKSQAALTVAMNERFPFSPKIGVLVCWREAVWEEIWQHNVKKGNVRRHRTQSDPSANRNRNKQKEAPFKRPLGRAPKRRPLPKTRPKNPDEEKEGQEEVTSKTKTFTVPDEDYIQTLKQYNTLPSEDQPETEMEVDEVEVQPAKKKRGRPKKVKEPEMSHEEMDRLLHLLRDYGIINLNQNIRYDLGYFLVFVKQYVSID